MIEKKSKLTQQNAIILYLREHGSATVRDLFTNLDINSPSKRISELRQLGMIEQEKCTSVNASGEKKRYMRYYLKEVTA